MLYHLGFGSNVGNREEWLNVTVGLLRNGIGTPTGVSSLFFNRAIVLRGEDPEKHPEYLNTVIALESVLTPTQLMSELLKIERTCGRNRIEEGRWGDRTVDLDIIACGDVVVECEQVTIPHPRMHERDFVLIPFYELSPDWIHPILGCSLPVLIKQISSQNQAVSGMGAV